MAVGNYSKTKAALALLSEPTRFFCSFTRFVVTEHFDIHSCFSTWMLWRKIYILSHSKGPCKEVWLTSQCRRSLLTGIWICKGIKFCVYQRIFRSRSKLSDHTRLFKFHLEQCSFDSFQLQYVFECWQLQLEITEKSSGRGMWSGVLKIFVWDVHSLNLPLNEINIVQIIMIHKYVKPTTFWLRRQCFVILFVLCRNLATSHVWSTFLLVILFIFKLTERY